MGFKRVSAAEISAIKTNSGYVYNIGFYKDGIYEKLKMRDLQIQLYNSGSIINIDLTILKNYNPEYIGGNWNSLKGQEFFKFNLNF